VWLLAFCLLFAAVPAWADLQSGLQAFQNGDYPTAQRELLPLQADPDASYALGVMADHGLGTRMDPVAAARFFSSAAKAGHVAAMVNLGLLYDHGRGVPRDGYVAQQLYSGAGRKNNTMAKNNLAYLWGRQNGLLEEALCLSAETLQVEPRNAYFLDTYGFVLLRLNRIADAQRFFEKALQVKPDYAVALEHLGDIARLQGNHGAARSWWQRARDVADRPTDMARLQRKLAGQPDDLDAHPPFKLDNNGFGRECAMPTV
jgi:Tfp pilus assembly protein PilF